jgi:hypothetical protein
MPQSKKEDVLQSQICEFIRYQYPNVVFISDASGLKLPIGQAVKFSKLKSEKGVPDLIIMEPNNIYNGIAFELKRDIGQYLKKDGTIRQTAHIIDQYRMLKRLEAKGYLSGFVHSLDMAINTLEHYFKKPDTPIILINY